MNDEIPAHRRWKIGKTLVIAGIVLLAIAAVMWLLGWNTVWHTYNHDGSIVGFVVIAAILSIGVGLANLRRRR